MQQKRPMVTILMSVYNGERYLKEQIDSILNQSYEDFIILVRDDGSTDNSVGFITQGYADDKRVALITDNLGNLGPALSFIKLIEKVDTEFFFLCDQDDVWLPDKINSSLNNIDDEYDSIKPFLSFTDLTVVDANLSLIHRSFNKRQRLNIKRGTTLEGALMQNVVTGCTIMGNKALAKFATSSLSQVAKKKIIMHDWWLALIAICFGRCVYFSESNILYRQHGNNCLGSTGSGFKKIFSLLASGSFQQKTLKYISAVSEQAEEFIKAYHQQLEPNNIETLRAVSELGRSRSAILYFKCLLSNIKMSSLDRDLAVLAVLATTPKLTTKSG